MLCPREKVIGREGSVGTTEIWPAAATVRNHPVTEISRLRVNVAVVVRNAKVETVVSLAQQEPEEKKARAGGEVTVCRWQQSRDEGIGENEATVYLPRQRPSNQTVQLRQVPLNNRWQCQLLL